MPLTDDELALCLSLLDKAAGLDPSSSAFLALERRAAFLRKSAKKRRKQARHADATASDRATVAAASPANDVGTVATLRRSRVCYGCGQAFFDLHPQYPAHCRRCGDAHARNRDQPLSLVGRRALVTGGRVKIGFATSLRLLRAGAEVLVTTRFPQDALARYEAELDVAVWRERLRIEAIDLRDLGALLGRIDAWNAGPPFDILVNNAALTIWMPPTYDALRHAREHAIRGDATQDALVTLATTALDRWGDPVDRRGTNSWTTRLADVAPIELVETHVVNALAPFLLCSRLKASLLRSPFPDRYIVNVSAMEGVFHHDKSDRHPHTNMAKAALNMLTRTSAPDYAADGIYMCAVDPGWVSDEGPLAAAERRVERGFRPPLTLEDAAARVCDPIARGVVGAPVFGVLLKDFDVAPW